MNPLDRLTTIISRLMGKEPDDPDVLEAVVEVVMAIRPITGRMAEAGMDAARDAMDSDWSSDVDGNRHDYSYLRSDAPAKIWQAMIDALVTDAEEM